MPSDPHLFDDEEAAAGPGDRDTVDTGQRTYDRESGRRPNYLFRRAVVVGGVVAVIATASIVIGQLISNGNDETASGALGADWNRVVVIDDRTGRVVVDDAAGDEVARVESGIRSPSASALVDSTLVVAGDGGIAVVDVGDESTDEFEFGADTIVRPAGSALTMVAVRPDGTRALLVHGPSGDAIDTDVPTPVVGAQYEFADARAAPSGRHVLVTDSGNFQSVLFSFGRDQPSFFPGLALAVDDDRVVTAQNVGSDATINVFDHDGEPVTTGRTASVRAGMIAGDRIVLLTVDGGIVDMSTSSGDTTEVGQLEIGTITSGVVAASGDRLVIAGATGTAIVGADGAVVATFDELQPADADRPPMGSTCVGLVSADDATETQITVVALIDGAAVAEASGTGPLLSDASGCVVVVTTAEGYDVLTDDGVHPSENGDRPTAVAPDGEWVVAERDRRIVLVPADAVQQPDTDPVDLGPLNRTVHFAQT
jgi:hypothetical protein